jgi:hypothetical protein
MSETVEQYLARGGKIKAIPSGEQAKKEGTFSFTGQKLQSKAWIGKDKKELKNTELKSKV